MPATAQNVEEQHVRVTLVLALPPDYPDSPPAIVLRLNWNKVLCVSAAVDLIEGTLMVTLTRDAFFCNAVTHKKIWNSWAQTAARLAIIFVSRSAPENARVWYICYSVTAANRNIEVVSHVLFNSLYSLLSKYKYLNLILHVSLQLRQSCSNVMGYTFFMVMLRDS